MGTNLYYHLQDKLLIKNNYNEKHGDLKRKKKNTVPRYMFINFK